MNYVKNYYDYINYVKTLNRYKGDGNYYENHHIIPKSLGGKNEEENLVLLTAREHFLAHYLLTKIYTEKEAHYKMVCSFNLLLSFEKKNTVQLENRTKVFKKNSRFYSYLKEKYCKELSSLRKNRKLTKPRKKAEKRYWIFNRNSSKDKMVLLEEIPEYLEKGWQRGRLNKKKAIIKNDRKKVRIFNEKLNIEKSIFVEDLETFLLDGWKRGRRKVLEETKIKHKKTLADKNSKGYKYIQKIKNKEIVFNPPNTGKKVLNKNGKYIYVKTEEINDYLKNGWKIGGKPKSDEWKKKMSIAMIGNQNGIKTKGE